MKLTIQHALATGTAVVLVVHVDADGAIITWDVESPETGERVELSVPEQWRALPAMHAAIALMHRGAA